MENFFSDELLPEQTKSIMIDGQDASGKGTVILELSKLASDVGLDPLLVDYPNYNLPWGKVLTHLLKVDDEGLEVKDRMLVYALNRLETATAIQAHLLESQLQGKKPVLLMDRCHTSNILTAAYYFHKKNTKPLLNDLDNLFSLYNYMLSIDSHYLELLGISENWNVWVPLISAEMTMQRLNQDKSRNGSDNYERLEIQATAADIYRQISLYDLRVKTFDQFDSANQKFMTPIDIASNILFQSGLEFNSDRKGNVERLVVDESALNESLCYVTTALRKYASAELAQIDPYSINRLQIF